MVVGQAQASPSRLPRDVRIGEWWLRPDEGLLVREGEEVRLRPRSMEVLVLLATRPGRVVSKEEIFAEVWEGNSVEDGALAHCISEIRSALGDTPRNPRYVETVPKRGYRLVAAVTPGPAAASHSGPEVASDPGPPVASHRGWARRSLAASGLLTALAAAGLLWLSAVGPDRESAVTPAVAVGHRQPRVAVLGFSNLSGAPQARWLSTALSEMLTTELAMSGAVRAIPGEMVARIKGELSIADADRLEAEALLQLRAGMGVDYVVVGSYLAPTGSGSGALRLDLRLQDHRSGEIVAAVVETGTVDDLADLVQSAGLRLRRALGEEGQPADQEALLANRRPASSAAAQRFFQGLLHLRRFEAAAATELLQRSAAEDPDVPQTHFALAEAWSLLGYDTRAAAAAEKAMALAGGLPRENRLWMEARCQGFAGHWSESIKRLLALRLLDPANFDYGLELARAQLTSGSVEEALATIAALKSQRARESRDPRYELLAAEAAAQSGDHARSVAEASRARELARKLGANLAASRALLHEAKGLHSLGRVAEAEAALEEARKIFAAAGDRNGEAAAGVTLSHWLWLQGGFERSELNAREALAIYQKIGNRAGEAEAMERLGMNVWRRGDAAEGERLLLRGLAIFREIGNRPGEAETLSSLAISIASFGGSSTSGFAASPCILFEQALGIYRKLNDRDGISAAVTNLGRCALLGGNVVEATRALEESVAIHRELDLQGGLATVLFNRAYARYLAGALAAAEVDFLEVIRLCRRLENPLLLAAAVTGLGTVRMMAADFPAAEKHLAESLRLRREIGDQIRIASALSDLSRLRLLQGNPEQAESLAREAVARADKIPEFYGAEMRLTLASTLLGRGRPEAARAALGEQAELSDPKAPITVHLLAGRITLSRVLGASGAEDRGRAVLTAVIAWSKSKGLVKYRLEAELARFEIDARSGLDEPARRRLQTFAEQSRRRGFVLFSRQADELLAAGKGRPEAHRPAVRATAPSGQGPRRFAASFL